MKRAFWEWSLLLCVSAFVGAAALLVASSRPEWPPQELKFGRVSLGVIDRHLYVLNFGHQVGQLPPAPRGYASITGEDTTGVVSLPGMAFEYLRKPSGTVNWRFTCSLFLAMALMLLAAVICVVRLRRLRRAAPTELSENLT